MGEWFYLRFTDFRHGSGMGSQLFERGELVPALAIGASYVLPVVGRIVNRFQNSAADRAFYPDLFHLLFPNHDGHVIIKVPPHDGVLLILRQLSYAVTDSMEQLFCRNNLIFVHISAPFQGA